MKTLISKTNIFFRVIILTAVIVLILTGCASILYGVNIRTASNISSVLAGGTLNLRTSGRDIVWSVSSRSDGLGAVAAGTFITQNGVLTVAANETASFLYITARSTRDGYSDTRQIRIVTVTGITITPVNQTVAIGNSLQFRAQVLGSNNPDNIVTWGVSANAAGIGTVTPGTSIDSNGVLTVARNETLRTIFVIATSVIDTTKSGSTFVSVVVPTVTSVIVNPATQTALTGSVLQLQAFVTGTNNPDPAVTWRVSSNPAGTGAVTPGTTIDPNGVLIIAPNETLGTLFVIATSVYDPTKSGSVPITTHPGVTQPPRTQPGGNQPPHTPPGVTQPPRTHPGGNQPPRTTQPPVTTPPSVAAPTVTSITISQATHATRTNTTVQFQATVTGDNNPNTAVTWRVSSNEAGTGNIAPGTTINNNGLLRVAPNEWSVTLYVFATSVADPSKTATSVVTITNNNPNQGGNQGQARP